MYLDKITFMDKERTFMLGVRGRNDFLSRLKEHPSSYQHISFLETINVISFSLNSQQILVNKVSNDKQCSFTYREEKCIIFSEN